MCRLSTVCVNKTYTVLTDVYGVLQMTSYKVYLNDNFLNYQMYGLEPTVEELKPLGVVEAKSLEEVFQICNDEHFIIKRSLSVGDVIESLDYGNKFIVEKIGFRRLDAPVKLSLSN